MRLYAMAVQALYGKAPARVSLYLTEADRFVDIDCGPEAMARAKEAVTALMEADRTHDFPPDQDRCPNCEHRVWCKPELVN
jgi:hypothetical protein